MSAPYTDPLGRFNASWIEDQDGCHIWQGGTDKDGYGRFYADALRYGTPDTDKAHRWIFQMMYGYAPEVVMHKCDTPACVNWKKCLRPGTPSENTRDMIQKGRHRHGASGGARGERHHKVSLSDVEVSEIRREYPQGVLTQRMLAEAYGVSRSGVSLIVNGMTR